MSYRPFLFIKQSQVYSHTRTCTPVVLVGVAPNCALLFPSVHLDPGSSAAFSERASGSPRLMESLSVPPLPSLSICHRMSRLPAIQSGLIYLHIDCLCGSQSSAISACLLSPTGYPYLQGTQEAPSKCFLRE